ncbi:hypothetical protein GGR56DRAFT_93512 [Xylariaceae sp. FL0804]|nr:hypothetical protein GGR56DRAFT_93512 [Xylariaceae sp. FL0804]
MFERSFRYRVTEFPIPARNSYIALLALITTTLAVQGPALLVIHYGGHGDRDDDRHEGQERRSVWAAADKGEPTLEWYRIQDQMMDSDADIVLLLDCCFAAQAGRDRRRSRGSFEILAAAAMGVKTPMPGKGSFTSIVIDAIQASLESEGSVRMKDLHGSLCNRQYSLYATPVHITLKSGRSPIFLKPLPTASATGSGRHDQSSVSVVQLRVSMEEVLNESSAEELAEWLKSDVPRVGSHVEVIETTQHIQNMVHGIASGEKAFSDHVGADVKGEIEQAWQKVVSLISSYLAGQRPSVQASGNDKHRRAFAFLAELDVENHHLLDTLERSILHSADSMSRHELESTVEDESLRALGISEGFRMRKIIRLYATSMETSGEDHNDLRGPSTDHVLQETKKYGEYLNPRDIPDVERRIRLLRDLLGVPKSLDFRTLQCCGYTHNSLEFSFELNFEVPPELDARQYFTLGDVIEKVKGAERPSLDDRLKMALKLARAVQKWHSVDWVHQGISSLNVIFFARAASDGKKATAIDYGMPFLHGFEYARPDPDPSIGHPSSNEKADHYRHPEVQGPGRRRYLKPHDLYSLGVVMLEIGLWQTARDLAKAVRPTESSPASPGTYPRPAEQRKHLFLRHCTGRLPHYAGLRYTEAVRTCLSSEFGVDVDDRSGSRLTRAFQSKVIDRLALGVSIP